MKRLPKALIGKALAVAACGAPLIFLNGCGGGGGSSSGSSGTPRATSTARPTATPAAGARRLIVQLRDSSNGAVDGIVQVGNAAMATQGGQAIFFGVAAGTVRVIAEVNGISTEASANVAASGPTTVVLTIAPRVTPAPTGTLPAPPF